ncbi:LpqN/LpqT family lipoprotein [Mycobacterium sp. GA-1285]|uniref:LpqN/LpqT family lipoprotein n=1 Tax=Mycobacterium sp. GA-1285 TaxID=1772282 RepID=UPI0020A47CBD|nr:LpqN/LpqT family lipoprotein [Mycobacterium sp. GA-1285]
MNLPISGPRSSKLVAKSCLVFRTSDRRRQESMKNLPVRTTAGLCAVALSFGLVACGSSADTAAATTTSATSTIGTSAAPSPQADDDETINEYITDSGIAETPIKPGEPGTPNFEFPIPPQWSDAGEATPEWAYGAIVYDNPKDPNDPPDMYAIASKLTGNVDAAKIFEYAPEQLEDMAEFKPLAEPTKGSFGGFDSISFAGTFMDNGKPRFVAQKTVVVPAADGLFVLQLNADSPESEQNVVLDAIKVIDEQTTIGPPS